MRKTYKKPTIQIENFVMDIEIMLSANEEYNSLITGFEAYLDLMGWTDLSKEAKEEKFAAYLAKKEYDNSTSGYCYFSAYVPS